MAVSRCALLPVRIGKDQIRIRAFGDSETRLSRHISRRRAGCRCARASGWPARGAICCCILRLPCSYPRRLPCSIPGSLPAVTLELPCGLPCGTGWRAVIGNCGRYGPAAPSPAAPSRSPDFYAPTYAGPDAVRPLVREETTDSFWGHFSHTKSFFGNYVCDTEPSGPGFGPNPGRRVCIGVGLAARGGATGASAARRPPQGAAATPAWAWEGARRPVQGKLGKIWRNRRVSCRPFRGVDFSGGV
jgi:hypothetical protein